MLYVAPGSPNILHRTVQYTKRAGSPSTARRVLFASLSSEQACYADEQERLGLLMNRDSFDVTAKHASLKNELKLTCLHDIDCVKDN